VFLFFQI